MNTKRLRALINALCKNVEVVVSEYVHRLARTRTACTDPRVAELFEAIHRNEKRHEVFEIGSHGIDDEE